MSWAWNVFSAMVLGSVGGVFYPHVIRLFKQNAPLVKPQWLSRVNDVGRVGRVLVFLFMGVIIAAILAAIGFGTFLGNAENQKSLQELGFVAYFLAFSTGFAAGSACEEPIGA